jgi:hypothetical protein
MIRLTDLLARDRDRTLQHLADSLLICQSQFVQAAGGAQHWRSPTLDYPIGQMSPFLHMSQGRIATFLHDLMIDVSLTTVVLSDPLMLLGTEDGSPQTLIAECLMLCLGIRET